MKLSTDIEINDDPHPTFTTTLADMHGEDGTEGSISIVSAPFGTTQEGSPGMMGVRASQFVQFEHEGRYGRFDLAELFKEWVDEIGDREPSAAPLEDDSLAERRARAKKSWEEAGEPAIFDRSREALD